MKTRRIYLLVLLMLAFGLWGTARAAVITFDDLPGGGADIPDGYGGFNWTISNGYSHSWRVWEDSYPSATWDAPSPHNAATNYCDAYYVGISSNSDFNFNGAFFSRFEDSESAASFITIVGFNDGALVGAPITLNLLGPYTWFQIDLLNVDMITFTPGTVAYNPYIDYPDGFNYKMGWFSMDNFTYNETVPEPATIALLGLGLLGVAGFRKKLKR